MYHYQECGLNNIYLVNGYRIDREHRYGELLLIDDVLGLHREIGRQLVQMDRTLTGAEFRFLRSELDLSRRALGLLVGANEQSIAQWEKAATKPVANRAAERMLRLYFLKFADEDDRLSALLGRLAAVDEQQGNRAIRLSRRNGGWLNEAQAA